MKRNHLYIFFISILLLDCNTDVTDKKSNTQTKLLPSSTNVESKPKINNSTPVTSLICQINTRSYRSKMGLGIMSLTIRPGDSITFSSSPNNTNAKSLVIGLNEYWKLISTGKNQSYFTPFKYSTNFENYGFIWINSDIKNQCEEIILSNNDQPYWLCSNERSKCKFITWEDYLHLQRVRIEKNNPIYSKPDEKSEIKGYPSGVYYIFDVQEMWIKIALIDIKNPSQKLESMQTVGWVKWYCQDMKRIKILDDTDMEDNFQN